jgi:hypothetical protein
MLAYIIQVVGAVGTTLLAGYKWYGVWQGSGKKPPEQKPPDKKPPEEKPPAGPSLNSGNIPVPLH